MLQSRRPWFLTTALITLSGFAPTKAVADFVATASDKNGNAATATFLPATHGGVNGIAIILQNTESNTLDAGNAISGISFTVVANANLGLPSALTLVRGTLVTFSQSGQPGTVAAIPVDDNGPYTNSPPSHWGFGANGTTITLETAGNVAQVGAPTHLIVAAGSTPNGSLVDIYRPSFDTSALFFVADSAVNVNTVLNASDITNVKILFGIGPDYTVATSVQGSSGPGDLVGLPAPPSVVLLGLGGACLAGYAVRSCRRQTAAA
jgi:hypothetical protein